MTQQSKRIHIINFLQIWNQDKNFKRKKKKLLKNTQVERVDF